MLVGGPAGVVVVGFALWAARAVEVLMDRLRRGPVGPWLSTASLTIKGTQ
jgi:hypothetical protein